MVIISKKLAKPFFSIRWRLVITYFIIILLTLFLINIYIQDSLKEYFSKQKEVEILTRANIISKSTSTYIKYSDELIEDTIKQLEINKDIRVIVTDKEAKVLFDTVETNNLKGKVLLKEEVVKALKGDNVKKIFEDETGWTIDAAVPVIKDKEIIGVIYLSASAQDISDFLKDIKKNMYTIAFMISILIGVLSFVLAGIITGPVEELTEAITNMAYGLEGQKVEVRGNDEIAQLSIAFNKMSERLNELEEKRRQFVSDASHELKTPLSSIKVLADTLLQMEDIEVDLMKEFLNDINNEINRLSRITDKLLLLTKMDILKRQLEFKEIDIRKILQDIIKSLLPLSKVKDISMKIVLDTDIVVLADEDKLWECIFNIVHNSIKYTEQGGKIRLTVVKSDYHVIIIVEDNGIGISEDEINNIFDRFYRVDKARARDTGGTGLGLSIALSAINLLEGDIQVESQEGKGSKFTIILPFREI